MFNTLKQCKIFYILKIIYNKYIFHGQQCEIRLTRWFTLWSIDFIFILEDLDTNVSLCYLHKIIMTNQTVWERIPHLHSYRKKNSIQASTFPKGDFIITSFLKHILKKLNITDLKWFVQFQCNRHPCWIFDNIRSIYPLFLCWCNKSVGISKRLKALASCIWLVDYNIFWYMIDWIVINICLEWKKQM